ncbi:enoyl-CoA hydratase [Oleisolibacter albus]|uniref:enoyl-CoA hydratase n=1 Tax=Oleisolibacter albus TaxID=2171757 RepID=UPI000DF1669F|nr:enoyl-CoA hydratase [Oleisolibacter albus]
MSSEPVLIQDQDGVRTITMNRPEKRNALTPAMYSSMTAAMRSAEDDGIRAVLFRGAGGFFTGGNDIMDFLSTPPVGEDSPVFQFLYALAEARLPLLAAVEGMAVGIGTTMLLHCDLVYATPDARFHVPFIDLGLVPEAGSSLLFPRTMGHARAARLLMLGEAIGAEEAMAAGILTGIVPADGFAATVEAKARTIAAKPAGAMRQTKALMKPSQADLIATIQREGEIFSQCLRSPEAVAAFQAFLNKGRK